MFGDFKEVEGDFACEILIIQDGRTKMTIMMEWEFAMFKKGVNPSTYILCMMGTIALNLCSNERCLLPCV